MQWTNLKKLYIILVSTFTSLAPASKVRVTLTRASPDWQKSIMYTWENAFNGLCHRLPTCYSSVVITMRSSLEEVSACGLFTSSSFLALEKHQYCIHYPARMRRGKVIIVVVVIVVVDTKIAKSGDVHTWASCKHHKYVKFGEKLASVCSESNGTACESHK